MTIIKAFVITGGILVLPTLIERALSWIKQEYGSIFVVMIMGFIAFSILFYCVYESLRRLTIATTNRSKSCS